MQPSLFVKIATVGLFSVGSFSVAAGSFLFTKTLSNTATAQIITDISRYPEIRNQKWSDIHQIKHFPVEIIGGAKALSMAYSPGLMQGSSFFQIRLQQPPDQIQKLLSQYSKIAVHQYWGGDTNDHIKAQDQGQPGFQWQHGHSYGVAIDSSASEIIYWVEKW
jgi:hypothetical protein